MRNFLEFEKPIAELEGKIEELKHLGTDDEINIAEEVGRLQIKAERLLRQTYGKLTPWQKVQVARHPDRPHTSNYIGDLLADFTPLAGDRRYAEDHAIIGGLGRLHGYTVMAIGTEKGNDTESRLRHNFGMARPEGYRKAQRLMRLAEHFSIPVVTFIDTSGAYPGVGAEERGQAEAIARSIEVSVGLRVPVIAVIIGEGGSGGAIALASADRLLMLEHAIFSVISPEGCASILWRDGQHTEEAAQALGLTSQDLSRNGAIDEVIEEPLGGAHRDKKTIVARVGGRIAAHLDGLRGIDGATLRANRRARYLNGAATGG